MTPFEVKGPEDESAKQGYLKLAGSPNTAWIRRGMPGKKQEKFSRLCTPWIRPIIHCNTLYVLGV